MDDENNKASPLAQRYDVVNGTWPMPAEQLPPLTDREAISAARQLYRYGFSLFDIKRSFKGSVRVTSGNRATWVYPPRAGHYAAQRYVAARTKPVLAVNVGKGWHHLVHDLSHYVHSRATRERGHEERGHLDGHAWVERQMIEYVLARRWLDGTLKRPVRARIPRPVLSKHELQFAKYCERLRYWEQRLKRAENKVRKYKRATRRYEARRAKSSEVQAMLPDSLPQPKKENV